jgi:hypothetical protein
MQKCDLYVCGMHIYVYQFVTNNAELGPYFMF